MLALLTPEMRAQRLALTLVLALVAAWFLFLGVAHASPTLPPRGAVELEPPVDVGPTTSTARASESLPSWSPTFSHGPMLPALRVGYDEHGRAVVSANGALGYSLNVNVLRDDTDKTLWWASAFAFASAGIGAAAVGSGQALDASAGAGVGFYNCLVRLGVGVELFDVALSPGGESSGVLVAPRKANLFFLLATGVALNL